MIYLFTISYYTSSIEHFFYDDNKYYSVVIDVNDYVTHYESYRFSPAFEYECYLPEKLEIKDDTLHTVEEGRIFCEQILLNKICDKLI